MAKKSVFNKPMREMKPAKKIPVKFVEKPPPVIPNESLSSISHKASLAIDDLRQAVIFFKIVTGEQDVNRARLNLFLAELESAINRVAAVFEP